MLSLLPFNKLHKSCHKCSIFQGTHQLLITHSWVFPSFSFRSEREESFSVVFVTFWVVFFSVAGVSSFLIETLHFGRFLIVSECFSMVSLSFPSVSLQIYRNLSSSFLLASVLFFRKRVMLSSSLQQHSPLVIICFILVKLSIPLVRNLLEMVVPYVEIIVRKYLFELEYWEFLQVSWENLEELLQLLILLLWCGEALLLLCISIGLMIVFVKE